MVNAAGGTETGEVAGITDVGGVADIADIADVAEIVGEQQGLYERRLAEGGSVSASSNQ
jgi:hypothetical protein